MCTINVLHSALIVHRTDATKDTQQDLAASAAGGGGGGAALDEHALARQTPSRTGIRVAAAPSRLYLCLGGSSGSRCC